MLIELLVGSVMIIITLVIQVVFIGLLIKWLRKMGNVLVSEPKTLKFIAILSFIVLWLVAGLSVSAWCWAILFVVVDVFDTLETALYFSIVTFTTLGYGDVVAPQGWRILASLSAVNGLIIVGLNTAFLVECISKIRAAQNQSKTDIEAKVKL